MGSLAIPIGIIGAGLGGTGLFPCAPPAENYAAYYAETASPAYQWLLPDAGHNDFAEGLSIFLLLPAPGGRQPEEVQGFSGSTLIAFLHKHLLNQDGGDPWLTGEFVPESVQTVPNRFRSHHCAGLRKAPPSPRILFSIFWRQRTGKWGR